MKNSKRIAWQRGNFATFAEIEVELNSGRSGYDLTVPLGIDLVDGRWRSGVLLALSLLREKLPRVLDSMDTQVTIKAFRGQPGDTTSMAAAYVMFHAVAELLAPELLEEFVFDEEKAEYTIASPRIN
jgi:hypothetical protein